MWPRRIAYAFGLFLFRSPGMFLEYRQPDVGGQLYQYLNSTASKLGWISKIPIIHEHYVIG
jgi:hypothetical protein